MQKFFLLSNSIAGGYITVTGDDAYHITKSLRMKRGEFITVCDMQKNEYVCELVSMTSAKVEARIISCRKNDTEPPYRAYLYQAVPKGDKFDIIVQKAVEMGVYSITPFECERCVAKIDPDSADRKIARWQRIAEEAAKQCGRGIIPGIERPLTYVEMLQKASEADIKIFCYEGDGTKKLGEILKSDGEEISFVIGPEGGFSIKETEMAADKGFFMANLGPRILRCETAPGFVLSCISYVRELS